MIECRMMDLKKIKLGSMITKDLYKIDKLINIWRKKFSSDDKKIKEDLEFIDIIPSIIKLIELQFLKNPDCSEDVLSLIQRHVVRFYNIIRFELEEKEREQLAGNWLNPTETLVFTQFGLFEEFIVKEVKKMKHENKY